MTDDQAIQDYAALDFDAAIDRAMADNLEKAAVEAAESRRVMLAILTCSKEELLDRSDRSELDVLTDSVDMLDGYLEHLEAAAEMTRAAKHRVLSVLSTLVRQHEGPRLVP
jgi:hypothetical protein